MPPPSRPSSRNPGSTQNKVMWKENIKVGSGTPKVTARKCHFVGARHCGHARASEKRAGGCPPRFGVGGARRGGNKVRVGRPRGEEGARVKVTRAKVGRQGWPTKANLGRPRLASASASADLGQPWRPRLGSAWPRSAEAEAEADLGRPRLAGQPWPWSLWRETSLWACRFLLVYLIIRTDAQATWRRAKV